MRSQVHFIARSRGELENNALQRKGPGHGHLAFIFQAKAKHASIHGRFHRQPAGKEAHNVDE
jgi:hypothetical protein